MVRTAHRLIVVGLLGSACADAPAPGIPEWSLSEAPLLWIGTEGGPETEFHRVAGAVRLGDGEIAVADAGSNEVRYFGPDGTYRRSFGRLGSGPGEFRSMGRPIRFGDTLAVYDSRSTRLTLFRRDTLLETRVVRAPNAVSRFSMTDRLADGRWLGSTGVSPRFSSHPYRDSIALGIFPASGDGDMRLLGWFPGPWIVSIEGQRAGLGGFFRWVHARVVGQQIVVLDADQERLRRLSPDGSESPAGVLLNLGPPLTPELVAEARRRDVVPREDPVSQQGWLDARYDPAVLPAHPPFRSLLVDSENLIWLEQYRVDETQPGSYVVLTPDARPVASLTVPAGFRATDIGPSYILGIRTDADGVENIVMYRLSRT